jgi:dienelactone hydrolase
LADGAKSFMIDMWLARHTPEKVLPLLHKVIDAAKEEFADAVANGGGIYGVGYCFGAKYILLLGGQHADTAAFGQTKPDDEEQGSTKNGPFIKAGAVAHGAQVVPADIAAVTVPMSLVCVEDDPLFPEEIRKAGEDSLVKNGVEHEIKIYPGVPHGKSSRSDWYFFHSHYSGFAVLGDYDDSKIKEAQQQAFGEMLGWLQAH